MKTLEIISTLLGALPMVLASTSARAGGPKAALPATHIIAGVPWHEQANGLFCGTGTLASVFDHWGPAIDQKAIANVARSSSSGTWFQDMVRSGHFSVLSAAQGSFFQHDIPTAGFPERPLGYAAFAHWARTSWLTQVKALVARDIPVLVLVNFAPDGGGGHYRLVIGYDDARQLVYMLDPWGRDQNHATDWTGIVTWSYAEFEQSWNYMSEGTDHPYRGAVILPWTVELAVSGAPTAGSTMRVTADITYPCPAPFDGSRYPASDVKAQIALPQGMTLVGAPGTVLLGDMAAGQTRRVTWDVHLGEAAAGKTIDVSASGLVSGSVGAAYWTGESVSYPPYEYTDRIGGTATLSL